MHPCKINLWKNAFFTLLPGDEGFYDLSGDIDTHGRHAVRQPSLTMTEIIYFWINNGFLYGGEEIRRHNVFTRGAAIGIDEQVKSSV